MASFGEPSPMMTGSSMPPLQLGQIWGGGTDLVANRTGNPPGTTLPAMC